MLAHIDDPSFVQELGQFNLEINIPPKSLDGDGATQYEEEVRAELNKAEEMESLTARGPSCQFKNINLNMAANAAA